MAERRAAMLIDGEFWVRVSEHYRRAQQPVALSVADIQSLAERVIAEKAKPEFKAARVAETHFFRGHLPVEELHPELLRNEWRLQHELVSTGVALHYLPMSLAESEKGIDVSLAMTALDAVAAGANVLVLVTGDADFVPVVRRLQSQGVPVVVLGFDLPANGHREAVRTSTRLYREACLPVRTHELVAATRQTVKSVVTGVAEPAEATVHAAGPTIVGPDGPAAPGVCASTHRGQVSRLIANYGFINELDDPAVSWFFHESSVADDAYWSLREGDRVSFRIDRNPLGNQMMAVNVHAVSAAEAVAVGNELPQAVAAR